MKLQWIIMTVAVAIGLNSCGNLNSSTAYQETTERDLSQDNEYYDSERQLYFSCYNWDMDVYLSSTSYPSLNFQILSLIPLNLDEIKVSIPIESDYAVYISEKESSSYQTTDYLVSIEQPEYGVEAYPYYLYQCYRGTDWKKMRELHEAAQEAQEKLDKELLLASRNDPAYLEQKAIVEEFNDYQNLYLEDYQALTPDDLPTFYCYDVMLLLGCSAIPWDWEKEGVEVSFHVVTESFQTIEINIGQQIYTQNVGEVRIYEENIFQEREPIKEDIVNTMGEQIIVSNSSNRQKLLPWGDGRCLEGRGNNFTAQKDMTITGMYLYENKAEIDLIGAHVKLHGATTLDFYWDLKTSFDIGAGTEVEMYLLLEDEQLKELEYQARVFPVIQYEVEDKEKEFYTEIVLGHKTSTWLRYVAMFQEGNVKSYFNDYYQPLNETWREDIPW